MSTTAMWMTALMPTPRHAGFFLIGASGLAVGVLLSTPRRPVSTRMLVRSKAIFPKRATQDKTLPTKKDAAAAELHESAMTRRSAVSPPSYPTRQEALPERQGGEAPSVIVNRNDTLVMRAAAREGGLGGQQRDDGPGASPQEIQRPVTDPAGAPAVGDGVPADQVRPLRRMY